MHGNKGRSLALSGPRRFIGDLVHFAAKVPTVPVSRVMDVSSLVLPRERHPARPSWAAIFMKAYAQLSAENPPLRRALIGFPFERLYEHPHTGCALAVEREYQGEPGVFVGLFRAPEGQTIAELMFGLRLYKNAPIQEIGFFRQALRISGLPKPIRRLLWWSTLELSGAKRAKRFGTFGLSTYGGLGAESLHPISPLTTTLNYGPIDRDGRVNVKIVYDHRVLDGAYIARRLEDLEQLLNGRILDELRTGNAVLRTPISAAR